MELLVGIAVPTINATLKPQSCEFLAEQRLASSAAFLIAPQPWPEAGSEQLRAGVPNAWTFSVPDGTVFFPSH